VTADDDDRVSYWSYLALDELLTAQRPRSEEHDELLFIVIHQVSELWFKQLLHELAHLQRRLEAGDATSALRTLRRTPRARVRRPRPAAQPDRPRPLHPARRPRRLPRAPLAAGRRAAGRARRPRRSTDSRGDVLRLGPAPYLADAQLDAAVAALADAAAALA
jgi:hypothetical protein